jgi:hypothetical protein
MSRYKYAALSFILFVLTKDVSLADNLLPASTTVQASATTTAAPESVEKKFIIKDGTPLELQLREEVCAEDSTGGESVKLSLVSPVLASDGKTVLIAGWASAKGIVSHAERARRGGDPGRITISARSIHAVDGTSVPLSGFLKSVGKEASLMSVMWYGLYAKGQNPCIPTGSTIQASIDQETTVTVSEKVSP